MRRIVAIIIVTLVLIVGIGMAVPVGAAPDTPVSVDVPRHTVSSSQSYAICNYIRNIYAPAYRVEAWHTIHGFGTHITQCWILYQTFNRCFQEVWYVGTQEYNPQPPGPNPCW